MGTVEIQTARNGFLAGWTPETEALLAQYRQQGLSQTQIARRLGKSRTAVNNKVARMGLPRFPSPVKKFHTFEETIALKCARPERTDPLALLKRQATLPLPMPMPSAAPKECQWALNDGRPWRFCNLTTVYHQRLDGSRYRSAWCAEHIERVFACRAVEAAA